MSTALRTPEDRFAELPAWPHAPQYLQHQGLRVHYVDEGPRDAPCTVLCLHGQPTWGYLYRKMLPVFCAAGLRVVVPDLIGFGRSDKPVDEAWYRFDAHREMLLDVIEQLDLSNILLVVQDWGGLLGLTLPMAMPQRFSRLLVMNTALPTGRGLSEGFLAWRAYSNSQPDLAVGKLMKRACPQLSDAEIAAYDAPFPQASFKAGVRRFPNLVPDSPQADGASHGQAAATFWRDQWQGESFMAIGMQDPVLGPPVMQDLQRVIRGCPAPMQVAHAGHFVQEEGAAVAAAALKHFGLTAAPN